MRKGFIPTLTALVTAFLVTSAMALGPTVLDIPDVYIGDDIGTEIYTHVYRYTDALVLWDYVAHEADGTATNNGSTSDTLYWAWAAKAADLNGGTGAFLDPGNIVYSIIQSNAQEGTIVTPVQTEGSAAWTAEINNALLALGGNLSQHSVAAAGALTFRNIRVSPNDQNYPPPSPSAGTPAGYLDIQEATLYVTDTVTTPGIDATRTLIVTVESPSFDSLSGGAVWSLEEDLGNTSAFTNFRLQGVISNSNGALNTNPAGLTANNTGTALSFTSQLANPTDAYYFGTWAKASSSPLDPSRIYRFKGTLASSNASAASNPGVFFGINNRAGGTGWGYTQFVKGYAAGPQGATTVPIAGYLRPAAAGTSEAQFSIFDDTGSFGGTITASNLDLESVDPGTLTGEVQLATQTSFTRNDATPTFPNWGWFAGAYPALTQPTINPTPANLGNNPELIVAGNTNGSATQKGFAQWGTDAAFSATAGKLVVVEYVVTTSSAVSASIPDLWLTTANGNYLANFMMDRNNTAGTGPTATAKSYYVVFEGVAGSYTVFFRAIVETPTDNGDVRLTDVTVREYDMPANP